MDFLCCFFSRSLPLTVTRFLPVSFPFFPSALKEKKPFLPGCPDTSTQLEEKCVEKTKKKVA